MKTGKTRYTSGIGRTLLSALALVVLAAFAAPQAAQANTAANTTIRNEVTVNYQDTAGTEMAEVTGQVDVTVNLVASQPTLSDETGLTIGPNESAVYTYDLTATANGPDTYDLTVDDVADSGDFASASSTSLSTNSLTLGATSVAAAGSIAASGDTPITVPSDNANDGAVNGINDTSTVVINGEVFAVASVDDSNGGSPGTSTITVTGNGTATSISTGDVIGERQSFDLTVTPGTLVISPSAPEVTVTIGAQDAAASAGKAQDETVTSLDIPSLSVTKEVSVNGGAFAASANADPGDTLTYRITVTNGGTSDADSVVITDPEPQFTTYVAESAEATTSGAAYGLATTLTDTDTDADGYDFGGTTAGEVTYNAGTVPASSNVVLYFQVDVN